MASRRRTFGWRFFWASGAVVFLSGGLTVAALVLIGAFSPRGTISVGQMDHAVHDLASSLATVWGSPERWQARFDEFRRARRLDPVRMTVIDVGGASSIRKATSFAVSPRRRPAGSRGMRTTRSHAGPTGAWTGSALPESEYWKWWTIMMVEFRPDVVFPPGETLLETIAALGITQADLAGRMGRPTKTVNEIAKGKTAITPETALQLERVLGVPASLWLNLEDQYRTYLAREQDRASLRRYSTWLGQFPVSDMVKLGWIEAGGSKIERVHAVLGFFGVASPSAWDGVWSQPLAAFRKSRAFTGSAGAVAAWLRKGELEARTITCQSFDRGGFKGCLGVVRGLTRESQDAFLPVLQQTCAQSGVAVVLVRELPGAPVNGATRWLGPSKALMQLSFRYRSDDQFWFTFFHEAAHILLHGKRDTFIEQDERGRAACEVEADSFAANHLIPPSAYRTLRRSFTEGRVPRAAVEKFASDIGVAPGIVVGRLQHDGVIPFTHLNGLKRTLTWG